MWAINIQFASDSLVTHEQLKCNSRVTHLQLASPDYFSAELHRSILKDTCNKTLDFKFLIIKTDQEAIEAWTNTTIWTSYLAKISHQKLLSLSSKILMNYI